MAYSTMRSMAAPMDTDRRKLMASLGYAVPEAQQPRLGASGYGVASPATDAANRVAQASQAAPAAAPPREVPGIIQARYPQFAQSRTETAGAGKYDDLSPADQRDLMDYINLLYSMPDFKGRHERNQGLIAIKAQQLRDKAKRGAGQIDYSGLSKIGDQYHSLDDQMTARLAARGIGGSGIEAGARSQLAGNAAIAQGDYIRGLIEQQKQQDFQRELIDQQNLYGLLGQSTQANMQMQQDPGFWGDVLGIAGSLLPGVAGPIGGAIGGAVGGLFGGGGNDYYRGPYGAYGYR